MLGELELASGIKSIFNALGAKTSDSNYAVALLDKTTKQPAGVMDMSTLASVLGVYNQPSYIPSGSSITISKGKKTAILFCWANTAISTGPCILSFGRTALAQEVVSSLAIRTEEASGNVSVTCDSSSGDILVKNQTSIAVNFMYNLFPCEQ